MRSQTSVVTLRLVSPDSDEVAFRQLMFHQSPEGDKCVVVSVPGLLPVSLRGIPFTGHEKRAVFSGDIGVSGHCVFVCDFLDDGVEILRYEEITDDGTVFVKEEPNVAGSYRVHSWAGGRTDGDVAVGRAGSKAS